MGPRSRRSHCFNPPRPRPGAFQLSVATSLSRSAYIWVLIWPSQCLPPRAQGFLPAPVICSRPQGGLGFSKDSANMPRKEPNFCIGLKSDLLLLRCPRIDPEVQNHCHLWLPGSGWVLAMDEPKSQSTYSHQQLVPLSVLLSKDQQQTAFHPQYWHSRARRGRIAVGLGNVVAIPPMSQPLVSLETTYLLLLIPIPFSHLVRYRKKPA